jgi:TonB family protein
LRKLAACDQVVRGEFRDMTVQEVLRALGLEVDVVVTFRGRFPPERRDYRLKGLTLEQSLLEIARQTGVSYRTFSERSLVAFSPLPPDVGFVAPPSSGPLLAGVGNVTNPVLIPESKLEPEYPELARVARLEGNVILQAIIHADGTVGDVEVLRTNRPNMGFEDAAVEAVRQWRYQPAMQNGRPVEVYFTVFVEFKLH